MYSLKSTPPVLETKAWHCAGFTIYGAKPRGKSSGSVASTAHVKDLALPPTVQLWPSHLTPLGSQRGGKMLLILTLRVPTPLGTTYRDARFSYSNTCWEQHLLPPRQTPAELTEAPWLHNWRKEAPSTSSAPRAPQGEAAEPPGPLACAGQRQAGDAQEPTGCSLVPHASRAKQA